MVGIVPKGLYISVAPSLFLSFVFPLSGFDSFELIESCLQR